MNQCIHGIDLLRWMFGNEVDEVYGTTRQQFHDYLEAEDVGMANPNALVVANSAMQAVASVGMPEARIILSEAALYVANSKKSNAGYLAIDKALDDVRNKDTGEIPMHIRNAPASGMKDFGYGVGYKYPHDYPGHLVDQQYLPDEALGERFFTPDQ